MPPLYTSFQKVSRTEPKPQQGPQDGFRGGSLGFVKPGDKMPSPPAQFQHNGMEGQSQNQYQGQGQNPGQVQGQGHIQNQGQGSRPPVPSQGLRAIATYVGEPGQHHDTSGPAPPLPPGPPPSAEEPPPPPPPGDGPPQSSSDEYPMAVPLPTQLPPPPRVTQLTIMLKESKEVLVRI